LVTKAGAETGRRRERKTGGGKERNQPKKRQQQDRISKGLVGGRAKSIPLRKALRWCPKSKRREEQLDSVGEVGAPEKKAEDGQPERPHLCSSNARKNKKVTPKALDRGGNSSLG